MNARTFILDGVDRVIQTAKNDPILGAKRVEFAEYCRDRVLERLTNGRSVDCDEYRALLAMDGFSVPAAASTVDIAWVDDNDGRGDRTIKEATGHE